LIRDPTVDLSEMAVRVSAGPDQFAGDEYRAAVQGMQALIDRLKSVSRTLNPQDPAGPVLKARTKEIEGLRSRLIRSFKGLGGIDV
jgi:hypothetical protein